MAARRIITKADKAGILFEHHKAVAEALDPKRIDEMHVEYEASNAPATSIARRKCYVDAIANMFTITNMGHEFAGRGGTKRWEHLAENETEDMLREEYDSWLKTAKKVEDAALKHGLPLTLATAEAIWLKINT